MSVVRVLAVKDNVITVKGIDMLDGTPILDLKPHIIDSE
jgi:tRNA (Thr-GGU) A37 N-methylase